MNLQKNKFATRMFSLLASFANWLQHLPNRVTPPPFRLMQISSAFWQSRVLYVATRLDIAGALGDRTLSVSDIAEKVSAQADAIERLLRFLAAMGIFEQVRPHHFKNNKLSACLRQDHPQNIRSLILMHNSAEMCRPWYEQLETGVITGEPPFLLTHQQELFTYMASHSEFSVLFDQAMERVEALSGDSFATDFDWQRFERVFDIGGGIGSKSVTILRHHPRLRAEVVDHAHVIQDAGNYWQDKLDAGVLQRLSFSAGDVLETVPAANSEKDIYFLSAVFHGFDDATCIQALRNLAQACAGTGARIAILELITDPEQPDTLSTAFDMQMFMGTRGRERSLAQWAELFQQSALRREQIISLRGFGKIQVLQYLS